jgi:hypothetical protein
MAAIIVNRNVLQIQGTGIVPDISVYFRIPSNEVLHNFYFSLSIIRTMKIRRIKWAGHVARIGRRGMHVGYWWESQKERDH